MRNTKFTAGPWEVDEAPSGQICVVANAAWICGQIHNQGDMPSDEAEANARLIAAAPDLFAYAECSAALDCALCDPRYDPQPVLESHGWKPEENPGVFLSRIRRAAITKAVGNYLGRPEGHAA